MNDDEEDTAQERILYQRELRTRLHSRLKCIKYSQLTSSQKCAKKTVERFVKSQEAKQDFGPARVARVKN